MIFGQNITEDQVKHFVGPNADYYVRTWQKMDEKKTKNYGNLSVFLISLFSLPIWLVYRKMYKIFLIYAVFYLLLDFCEYFGILKTELPSSIGTYYHVIGLIFFTVRGNYLYKSHVVNKLINIHNIYRNEVVAEQIKKQGGTNILLPLIIGLSAIAYLTVKAVH